MSATYYSTSLPRLPTLCNRLTEKVASVQGKLQQESERRRALEEQLRETGREVEEIERVRLMEKERYNLEID